LAMGKWHGAERKDFGHFWAERFHVAVSDDLVYHVFAWLQHLRKTVQASGLHNVSGWMLV
jgi:hypothetical protein